MNDSAPAAPAPMRVLLLDDDGFMLKMLAGMLEELGAFDVVADTSSAAAVASLRRHRPHLLICDLSMPDMDGIEFLRLAADEAFQGGVVLLSGVDSGVRKAAERLAMAQGLRILGAYRKPMALTDLSHMLALAGGGDADAVQR